MNRYIWTLWTGAWEKPQPWDLLCLAVSVGFVRRFCQNTAIYTDETGAAMLDEYCIEGERRVMEFNIRPSAYPRFAEAKMKTLAAQETFPLCHIDHDVFLLKEQAGFPDSDIVVQSLESAPNHYRVYHDSYLRAPDYVYPPEMVHCAREGDFKGFNCGYIAVHNPDVLRQWCDAALSIAGVYDTSWKGDNIIIEQMPLYALAKYRRWKIGTLFTDPELSQLGPELAGYVHLMASKETDRFYVTSRLVQRAREVAPDFYNKCFADLLPR